MFFVAATIGNSRQQKLAVYGTLSQAGMAELCHIERLAWTAMTVITAIVAASPWSVSLGVLCAHIVALAHLEAGCQLQRGQGSTKLVPLLGGLHRAVVGKLAKGSDCRRWGGPRNHRRFFPS